MECNVGKRTEEMDGNSFVDYCWTLSPVMTSCESSAFRGLTGLMIQARGPSVQPCNSNNMKLLQFHMNHYKKPFYILLHTWHNIYIFDLA